MLACPQVTGLEDVITPAALTKAGAEVLPADSEFLQTVVLVINKQQVWARHSVPTRVTRSANVAQEEQFLATYESLDGQSVPLGPAADRESVRGSPVIPRSAVSRLDSAAVVCVDHALLASG